MNDYLFRKANAILFDEIFRYLFIISFKFKSISQIYILFLLGKIECIDLYCSTTTLLTVILSPSLSR